MSPQRVCRDCAVRHRVTGLAIFDKYSHPGVCEWCARSALVCWCEGPPRADAGTYTRKDGTP